MSVALATALLVGSFGGANARAQVTFRHAPSATNVYYDVVDLGGDNDYAVTIGSTGQSTGWTDTGDPNYYMRATRWTASAHKIVLAPLPGYQESQAYTINGAGSVVGESFTETGSTFPRHATLWTGNTPTDLGTLGGARSDAVSINDAGHVVGGSDTVHGQFHAFFWNGAMTDLGMFNGAETYATDINSHDDVIGTAYGLNARGFIRMGGTFVDLGTLGGQQAEANAINDRLDVVGESTLPGAWHAFVWQKGVMHDLGALTAPAGSTAGSSWGYDINNQEQVVGYSSPNTENSSLPYAWGSGVIYHNGVMADLNKLVPTDAKIFISEANGINDSGRIVGWGQWKSTQWVDIHAFLLVPRIHLVSLTVNPQTVVGSQSAVGKVTMNMPAPPGGATVSLTNTFPNPNPAASVPGAVTVPQGATSANFLIPTNPIKSGSVGGTITAKYDEETKTANLTVRSIGVKALILTPNPAHAGQTVTGKVVLEAPAAPGTIQVALSSTNAQLASLSVTGFGIPSGSVSGTFTISVHVPHGVRLSDSVIKATANGISKSRVLLVQ